MYNIILKKLICIRTEDITTDECRLEVILDGELKSPPFRRDMEAGNVWELNKSFNFNKRAELKLFDEDSPDPDDFLGSVTFPANVKQNGIAVYNRDDAEYKLYFDVVNVPDTQVENWREALTNFDRSDEHGVWTYINKKDLIDGIKERVIRLPDSAYKVNQGKAALCGPAAIVFELISKQPARYVSICKELYETGGFFTRTQRVTPRESLLKSPFRRGMQVADWMLLGTLRDTENALHPYAGEDYGISEKIAGITYPWEMVGWAEDLLCFDKVEYESFVFYGEFDAIRRAGRIRGSGGVAFMMINSAMFKDPEPLVSTPNHWVAFTGDLWISEDADTFRDIGEIEFSVFSWGSKWPRHKLSEERFEDHFWGLVTGEKPSMSGVGSKRHDPDDKPRREK